jgi:hypothetical protein
MDEPKPQPKPQSGGRGLPETIRCTDSSQAILFVPFVLQ